MDKGIPMLSSMASMEIGEVNRFYLCNGRANKYHSNELTLTNYRALRTLSRPGFGTLHEQDR